MKAGRTTRVGRPPPSGGRRGELLRVAAIRRQAATGLMTQLTQGAAGVGIILVVRQHTHSLALAGAVAGALSVAAGLSRPVQGRVIDRGSVRALMAGSGLVHALALGAIVWGAALRAPAVALVCLGCVAGFGLPPVSTAMRVQWAARTSASQRSAAFGLVYLTQELAILAGPLLLAAVIALASASAALIVVAALSALGSLGYAATLDRAPATRAGSHGGVNVLRLRAFDLVLMAGLLTGAVIGALEVAVPTLAAAHHAPAAAGVLIACVAVGGVAGAAMFASRRWQSPVQTQAMRLLAALTVVLMATSFVHGLALAGVLLLTAGLAINPALTTFSLLVDRHVADASAGEAFGWLSTGLAGGTGAASAIAAAVASHGSDAQAAFLVAVAAAALGTLVLATGRTALRGDPGTDAMHESAAP